MSEFIGNMVIPSPNDVRYGIMEGSGGTEFTGNFTLPLEYQVSSGIGFGSNSVEFSGTFVCPTENIDLFINGFDNFTDNMNLFIEGEIGLTKQIDLFIRGNVSGTPSVGDDNFGITLDQLFKNGDFNPQVIGRFTTNPSNVTIEVWSNDGNVITLTNSSCYQIGDTGRWAFSTINLPPLAKIVNQFIFRMTGDNLETFESQFMLNTRRKDSYGKIPRDNSQIRKV